VLDTAGGAAAAAAALASAPHTSSSSSSSNSSDHASSSSDVASYTDLAASVYAATEQVRLRGHLDHCCGRGRAAAQLWCHGCAPTHARTHARTAHPHSHARETHGGERRRPRCRCLVR
jgi:hypothetical protein